MIIQNNKILRKEDFKNEKELQNYVETNMKEILGYQFISTEFTVDNYRLDSLEIKGFENKRSKNDAKKKRSLCFKV